MKPEDEFISRAFGLRTSRPAFYDQAACRGATPDIFFVRRGESTAPVKATCDICPVTDECFAFAYENGESYGIWGGQSFGHTGRQLKAKHRHAAWLKSKRRWVEASAFALFISFNPFAADEARAETVGATQASESIDANGLLAIFASLVSVVLACAIGVALADFLKERRTRRPRVIRFSDQEITELSRRIAQQQAKDSERILEELRTMQAETVTRIVPNARMRLPGRGGRAG